MPRTFEELASQELDALYQGALFLRAGDRTRAEELLVETLTGAATEYAGTDAEPSVGAWLEGRLVRTYLAGAAEDGGEAEEASRDRAWSGETARLLEVAGRLPALPRAALWLVLLRRWSYAEASRALGVDDQRLGKLLAYRDVLFSGVMGGTGPMGAGGTDVEVGN